MIGLIAALSYFLIGGGGDGGKSVALQSAQATLANMITAARVHAMASGQRARVLVHVDPNSRTTPARYLRYLVVQVQVGAGWQSFAEAYLPDGIYVVPGKFATIPAGLFSATGLWTKADGTALRSTVLQSVRILPETINDTAAEQWVSFELSATGGTAQSGDFILATGVARPPGSFVTGDAPIELQFPDNVRGVTLSSYGVPALVNTRLSF